jgi:hypothetical protein
LKALLEKYFKLPKFCLKNLFDKTKYQKCYFLLLFKPMQACLQEVNHKGVLYLLKIALQNFA